MRSGVAVVLALVTVGVLVPAAATAEPIPPTASPVARTAWMAPLPGEPVVGRPFEPPPHRYGAGHRGVDLVGVPGSPVLAAGDGVVVFAGQVAGRPVVSIDHADGLRTTYEPVARTVGAGARVTRGSPIGTLTPGHGGCPAAVCLHWGLRRGEDYLDPLALLRPPRVRLLPLGGVSPGGPPSTSSSGRSRPADRPAVAVRRPVRQLVVGPLVPERPAGAGAERRSAQRRLLRQGHGRAPRRTVIRFRRA